MTYTASDATSGVSTPAAYTFGDGTGQSLAAITAVVADEAWKQEILDEPR